MNLCDCVCVCDVVVVRVRNKYTQRQDVKQLECGEETLGIIHIKLYRVKSPDSAFNFEYINAPL